MSVPVRTEPEFDFGTPELVLEHAYSGGTVGRSYDASPDGKRFLMIKDGAATGASAPELILVQNWTEELKRLVPTSR